MSKEFGRRLRDLVDGIRAETGHRRAESAGDAAAAAARRRCLEKAVGEEARAMVREAGPVLAGLGLRARLVPGEIALEPIPGARLPEKCPPWMLLRFRPPAAEDSRVAVLEVSWRVDDPRTPLPEAPSVLRFVAADDSPAGMAEAREFLAVAFEDFAAAVARFDNLTKP